IQEHVYNADCIAPADGSSTGQYQQGTGSVIVIAGTGGREMDEFDPTNHYAPYLAAWMGNNTAGYGNAVVNFNVDAGHIVMHTSSMGRTPINLRSRGHQPSACSTSFAHTSRSSRWLRLEWADSSSGLGRGREGRPKKGERASRGVKGRAERWSERSTGRRTRETLLTEPMKFPPTAAGLRLPTGPYRK